jgi:hypothetical protein
MLTATLIFALLSATLELILLLKFAPQHLLAKPWFVNTVHLTVAALNLAIHFGTLVGTMTAITAALVSFVTIPAALWIKTFAMHYRAAKP